MRKQELTWYTPSEELPKTLKRIFINSPYLIGWFNGHDFWHEYDDGYDSVKIKFEFQNVDEWAYID